ncbi:MAG: methylmalonyl-CoA carboxyltransferase, partial [Chloroflexi bacterium]|nr:methylmalonyl-CoA carboxyltransferase [Chloroflexota bacterium]
YSQDFTSTGGTLAETHGDKICRVLDSAMTQGCPVIGLNDSGGARIQDGVDSLSRFGKIFYRNTIASGVIPQICAILGPTAGGAVYSPALMDFTFMVKGEAYYAFITGPKVVKEILGEEVSEQELGGADAAQKKAGFVCRSENSETECFDNIKELLSYLPSNNREKPKRVDWGDTPDRRDDSLFNIVPANPAKPYDMHKVIEKVFDQRPDGKKNYFELFPQFAPNIITCFSRLNGWSVGIIANQPMSKAGSLDIDASDKASRFIRFCDAFNIPLVTLVDVPGYLPGTEQEWRGIIRHGAKMLYAYSEATVPRLTVTIRKAYGGSYIGMCSKDFGTDFVFCWPSTELAVMGAEGAVPIIFRKELEQAKDREAVLQEKIREYREEFANPYRAAQNLHVDDVIDPAETRPRLIEALEIAADRWETRPWRKHGIMPV